MNVTCQDRERILMDGRGEEWAALEAHAASCAECSEELRIWKSMSVAAAEMRQEWETPYLWTKIERALTEQMAEKPSRLQMWLNSLGVTGLTWQTAAALALVILVTGATGWIIWPPRDVGNGPEQVLLKDKAITDVERAEAAYQKAIDKLDAQARPELESAATPLMASYREKLLVLDNAIEELRAEAGQNPANAHLRRQLLAMYQEKQETLQEVLEAKR
jgi:hypothetical protein